MVSGFMYLAGTTDWFSRYVVAWRLSNTLDGSFCLEMLDEALSRGRPEGFNTDQGVQFTAAAGAGGVGAAGGGGAWTARGAAWATCSWSGCGGRSSTRTSTCGATRRCRSCGKGWGGTSLI